jgi:hypothetical protein
MVLCILARRATDARPYHAGLLCTLDLWARSGYAAPGGLDASRAVPAGRVRTVHRGRGHSVAEVPGLHIESVIWKRVEQGVLQARYTYEHLAAELTTDMQPS